MAGLSEPPAVSVITLAITGIVVDVYGLEEVPSSLTHVSVLWLHNPRLGDRGRMAPMAKRTVGEYNKTRPAGSTRGLLAVAFDQRNHGSREVHHLANLAWREGNTHHAQDMFGVVNGTVVDTRLLIDALPGYLFLEAAPRQPEFDQHLCLGVSLGGHSTWQTLFAEPRVTAGVSIIGCPDYQLLMTDRARLSKLSTYDAGGFLGSKDFPPALVAQCAQYDPKGIVFGTQDVVVESPLPEEKQAQVRRVLDRHVKGKKFLLCTGGDDKLVPWRCSEPFTNFFVNAAQTWYRDSGLSVDNRIYPGRGHECSDEMVVDAVRFVCEVVNGAETGPVGSRI
ncbi:hypothetical protein M406DRAFT_268223 [Cryphonectria parasitica EP155]|uniref:Uncharacterized protein n=1 Tax=Cryphonectria parasitica (strain ATCC 38755 / EP155) TaxID=660469 RepID=A0A9P4XTW2_CRYP1|nr:uncharacterized protein M406DRAFT_268223 [Cryphonectria parasitica EP155]KAF3761167.1 hypothetical protein M406DRAFT_268223 [Cryphonectria parasitica EP155]